jgi:Notch-like protein
MFLLIIIIKLFLFIDNGYWCFCNDGKNGFKCNRSQNEEYLYNNKCKKSTCFNDAKCLPMNNSIICACKSGYYGAKCEYKLGNLTTKEMCLTNVCQNNGKCSIQNGKGNLLLIYS